MPKKCTHFINGFLIPSLDSGKFGDHLKWIDRNRRIFQMDWHHKSGTKWTESEAEVFVEWDKEKGHFKPNNKEYYTESKQRFRSLLYKMTKDQQLIPMEPENKFQKIYRIGEKKKGRRRSCGLQHAESEPSTTDTSFEENDDEVSDDMYIMATGDFFHSAFADHSYSRSEHTQSRILGSYDQFEYADIQDVFGSPVQQLPKVQVRRNYNDELLNTTISTSFLDMKEMPEDFMEDYAQDAENINAIRPNEKLQENVFPPFLHQSKLMSENSVLSDIENTIDLNTLWNNQSNVVFDISQMSVENDPQFIEIKKEK